MAENWAARCDHAAGSYSWGGSTRIDLGEEAHVRGDPLRFAVQVSAWWFAWEAEALARDHGERLEPECQHCGLCQHFAAVATESWTSGWAKDSTSGSFGLGWSSDFVGWSSWKTWRRSTGVSRGELASALRSWHGSYGCQCDGVRGGASCWSWAACACFFEHLVFELYKPLSREAQERAEGADQGCSS